MGVVLDEAEAAWCSGEGEVGGGERGRDQHERQREAPREVDVTDLLLIV